MGCFAQCTARCGLWDCAPGSPLWLPPPAAVTAMGEPSFLLQIKIYYILC